MWSQQLLIEWIFSFFPLWFCVRCFFSPQKPTRTRRPGATPSNCCGLVVLWDKRLLSRHSGELHSLPAHIYRSPCDARLLFFLSSAPDSSSLRRSVIELSAGSESELQSGVEMCESDSEGRMKVTSPSQVREPPLMSAWIMWRGPLFPHIFSVPRSLTAATLHPAQWNALKVFFLMQMNATGLSA